MAEWLSVPVLLNQYFITENKYICRNSVTLNWTHKHIAHAESEDTMNADAELLNFIYQNSQMGVESMGKILPNVKEGRFKERLTAQNNEYKRIHRLAKEHLNEHGFDEKGIGQMQKLMTYMMIDMKLIMDSTESNIAQMLIKGSNMGIIDAQKNLNQYERDASKDTLDLMRHLMEFEEENVERLKMYL